MGFFGKLLLTVAHITLRVLDTITAPIFRFLYERKKHILPPITNPLLVDTAVDLAAKIRQKQVSLNKSILVI